MPIGAIIDGVASIGGAVLGASSTKKAAKTAANAQLQATESNNALARDLYNRNTANFTPYMQSGRNANALLDSFIYGTPYAPPAANNNTVGTVGSGGTGSLVNVPSPMGNALLAKLNAMNPDYGASPNLDGTPTPAIGTINSSVPAQQGQNPWDVFRNSTNYQFRLGEGYNALNSGWAGAGALQSGAAAKDAIRYGQNFASNELNNYLGLLQGQQALGAGAASSLAGVGNDFLGSVTANNRAGADAASNAALLRGQANQQLYGNIANALGGFASSFLK